MRLVGAKGTKVTAVALNDYVSSLPMEDFKKFKVIPAMKRDGNYMAVRDKGPCSSFTHMTATRSSRVRPTTRALPAGCQAHR